MKYRLTEEHKKFIPAHNQYWIDNALSTRRITKEEKPVIRELIKELYKHGGLTPPPDHRIIFAPSPFVARFAGGFAAWVWHCRSNKNVKATHAATRDATDAATDAATRDATYDATRAATDDATYAATYAATDAATRAATVAATHDATDAATYDATDAATRDNEDIPNNDKWYFIPNGLKSIIAVAKQFGNVSAMISCSQNAYRMYQGGNFWSGTSSFIEFGRTIAKLNIDYSKWDCYKRLSELSSYRIMHKEFCLISERPTKLEVQKEHDNRPHCETGPFCQWADGSALYALNGVRVPKWLVDTPAEKIDPKLALTEKNVDVQREIIRKMGAEKMLKASNAIKLDEFIYEKTNCKYSLYHMKLNGSIDRKYLYFEAASIPGVYYCQPVPPETKKALHGLAWMRHLTERDVLSGVNAADEAEMIAALPDIVS